MGAAIGFVGADGTGRTVSTTDLLPVEVLGVPGVARQLTATNTGQNQQLTATCKRVSIRCRTSDCRITVGVTNQSAAVNAGSSHFVLAGERVDFAVPLGAHIGYIRDTAASADGILNITELT